MSLCKSSVSKCCVLPTGLCGISQCDVYESCITGVCGCFEACSKEYKPVCAYTDTDTKKTFANMCEMRRAGCKAAKLYYIANMGTCEDAQGIVEWLYT